jgi:phosphoribosyl 1,2-cyclic phosphodiesterase
MKIKIWGARGSLPTPSKDVLKYGGNTTCIEIRLEDNTLIIIDAGSGLRFLGKEIIKDESIKDIYLFLTHAHWDHLMGFPFFIPAYFSKYNIYVKGGFEAKNSLKKYLKHQMEPPFFPVSFDKLKANFIFSSSHNISKKKVSTLNIEPIRISHPDETYGYKFFEKNKTFVLMTDNELDYIHNEHTSYDKMLNFCKDVDFLIHDAQYTLEKYKITKTWGHTTFDSAVDFAIKAKVKKLGLFHHDPDHTDEDIDNLVLYSKEIAKKANSELEIFAVKEKDEYII